MKSHIIVKAPLNTSFPDKPTFEGAMTEKEAHKKCIELNSQLRQDAEYSYKVRKA